MTWPLVLWLLLAWVLLGFPIAFLVGRSAHERVLSDRHQFHVRRIPK